MKVQVQVLTYNGQKYIKGLIVSLAAQTLSDFELVVMDNASEDNTVTVLKESLKDFPHRHKQLTREENNGYAGGHNQLYQYGTDVVIVVNQDMTLGPDCLEKLVSFLGRHRATATCAPLIMQMESPDLVDSMGLQVRRDGSAIDKGQGQEYDPKMTARLSTLYMNPAQSVYEEVFGVSGALFAVNKKLVGPVLFSEDYFAYKEDVDLAWRMRWRGYKSHVLHDAIAYHDRSAGKKSWFDKSAFVRSYSYRNHLATVIRNAPLSIYVLWYELKKWVFLLFMDRGTLAFAWRNSEVLKTAYRQRKTLIKNVSVIEIKRWLM